MGNCPAKLPLSSHMLMLLVFLRRRRRVRTLAYHITQENVKNPFPLASAVCLLQQIDLLPLLLLAFRLPGTGESQRESQRKSMIFLSFETIAFPSLRVIPPKSLLPHWDFLGFFCFGLYFNNTSRLFFSNSTNFQ